MVKSIISKIELASPIAIGTLRNIELLRIFRNKENDREVRDLARKELDRRDPSYRKYFMEHLRTE